MDDIDLFALVPRPTLALILVFPTSPNYEAEVEVAEKNKDAVKCAGSGDEDIFWYKQTVNNVCGFYGILHAVSNGDTWGFISRQSLSSSIAIPGSHQHHLLTSCTPLDRAASAYKTVALQGDSEVPEDLEEEVDFHYACFVKSHKDGHLYKLNRNWKGPMVSIFLVYGVRGLTVLREFIGRVECDGGFSLLALTPAKSCQAVNCPGALL
ncbi:putative ubiquitin carboxyl-terminal hydrolase [Triangularia setosa]|uniref:Ubiquitin carboxyl-terminal hydrolase n=1 Tax=Triangularia setosa TaxID=2587417 RepID=A0AAN6WE34_9PEZI|nr:putative ubiquitin carboxyl-terminal hydrolase [Podospora setosa]